MATSLADTNDTKLDPSLAVDSFNVVEVPEIIDKARAILDEAGDFDDTDEILERFARFNKFSSSKAKGVLWVARLSMDAAKVIENSLQVEIPRRLSAAGALVHDDGQQYIPSYVIEASEAGAEYTDRHQSVMEWHSLLGHASLGATRQADLAIVPANHHLYQAKPYGLGLKTTQERELAVRGISAADATEAMLGRNNARNIHMGLGERIDWSRDNIRAHILGGLGLSHRQREGLTDDILSSQLHSLPPEYTKALAA